jgi:hypothetical protein
MLGLVAMAAADRPVLKSCRRWSGHDDLHRRQRDRRRASVAATRTADRSVEKGIYMKSTNANDGT